MGQALQVQTSIDQVLAPWGVRRRRVEGEALDGAAEGSLGVGTRGGEKAVEVEVGEGVVVAEGVEVGAVSVARWVRGQPAVSGWIVVTTTKVDEGGFGVGVFGEELIGIAGCCLETPAVVGGRSAKSGVMGDFRE